jgi:hypothetical protein
LRLAIAGCEVREALLLAVTPAGSHSATLAAVPTEARLVGSESVPRRLQKRRRTSLAMTLRCACRHDPFSALVKSARR